MTILKTWYLILFSLISLIHSSSLYALIGNEYELQTICRSSELKRCWKKILILPEARRLINKIKNEGSFTLISNNHHHLTQQFGAFWDPFNRMITINCSSNRLEGDIIFSIIFELHNASRTKELITLDRYAAAGKIDRETYVQSVEIIEYQNALNASKIALQGVEIGIFPENTLTQPYPTFEEHYRIQKAGGHSTYIANNYTHLTSGILLNE